jgi:hypothetical protein
MTTKLGGTKKQIRILSNGKISKGDRRTHTTADEKQGGPDRVQWIKQGGGFATYIVRFKSSPFQSGPQDIKVPPGRPQTVSQPKGEYEYSVYEIVDGKERLRDDPDVIID